MYREKYPSQTSQKQTDFIVKRKVNQHQNLPVGTHCPPGPTPTHCLRREEGGGEVYPRHCRGCTVHKNLLYEDQNDRHKEVDS